jgi:hypothetical protein
MSEFEMKTKSVQMRAEAGAVVTSALRDRRGDVEGGVRLTDLRRGRDVGQRKNDDLASLAPERGGVAPVSGCMSFKSTYQHGGSTGSIEKSTVELNKNLGTSVQLKVPESVGLNPLPVAETGSYKATSGKGETYNSKEFPRSRFNFGKHTRNEVLSNFNNSKIGNRIVAVQDQKSGQMVNVEGIHLDHNISWAKISKNMDQHNEKASSGVPRYSFWDAKMYYNDIRNLHPVLGGLNSGAGENGVAKLEKYNPNINEKIARIQTSWMNLQNYISAIVNENWDYLDQEKFLAYLSEVESKLDDGIGIEYEEEKGHLFSGGGMSLE